MRTIFKAAAATAVGGVLLLGFTGTASAAGSGANSLNGQGCPSVASNSAYEGTYIQHLNYTYVTGNGFRDGVYTVDFYNRANVYQYSWVAEYRC
ncbi:hypothetical protein ACFV4P_25410 [Kitasatospora sp. NPDC059795]|uniref:hypothetical protein n=1 Tax=Kitasatospora sp. NPDC059795 TaxID=3346949 RepID=UPI00364AA82F